eukprot:scaffold913_cov138-Isochrysis_galbana.AAC.4
MEKTADATRRQEACHNLAWGCSFYTSSGHTRVVDALVLVLRDRGVPFSCHCASTLRSGARVPVLRTEHWGSHAQGIQGNHLAHGFVGLTVRISLGACREACATKGSA